MSVCTYWVCFLLQLLPHCNPPMNYTIIHNTPCRYIMNSGMYVISNNTHMYMHMTIIILSDSTWVEWGRIHQRHLNGFWFSTVYTWTGLWTLPHYRGSVQIPWQDMIAISEGYLCKGKPLQFNSVKYSQTYMLCGLFTKFTKWAFERKCDGWCLFANVTVSPPSLIHFWELTVHIYRNYSSIWHEQSFKRCWERQGNNNNTTERQSNTTQLARNSHFSKKNWLPRVGLEPTTISSPGDALTNWATEAAQLAGLNPAYKPRSISTWWTGELKLWYLGEGCDNQTSKTPNPKPSIAYEQSFKRCWERQGNNNNTTERQSNTTQLARNSHFSKKNWLPRVGLEPMTISSPGDALTNWATEAAQLAGLNPAYKPRSISTWWTGELKLWYLGEGRDNQTSKTPNPKPSIAYEQSFKRCWERQGNNNNTTQLARNSHFSKKNWLPRVGLEPTTISSPGDALTNWATEAAQLAGLKPRSISTWWTGELKLWYLGEGRDNQTSKTPNPKPSIAYEQSFKRCWERQGNNNNTTERQSNTTQLARNSHFSKKNWLPRVGLEPTTISSPGDALTNWATVYVYDICHVFTYMYIPVWTPDLSKHYELLVPCPHVPLWMVMV